MFRQGHDGDNPTRTLYRGKKKLQEDFIQAHEPGKICD